MTDAAMPATIELRGLRLIGYCGVLPEERERPQPLEFDIDLDVEVGDAARTDDLVHTVDYGSVCTAIEGLLVDERFSLLERLAARAAECCLALAQVEAVEVSVRKLRPPVSQQLATSGVRLRRARV